ncbi:DUF2087 domain-containing protein [bacterium]|nr:DUF2087 domain-containing protein [bacterium]
MDNLAHDSRISVQDFRKRIVNLLAKSALTSLPRKDTDKLCLLLALAERFERGRDYAEIEVNEVLQRWLNANSPEGNIDHVNLRRLMVDFKFLARSSDGLAYRLDPDGSGFTAFSPEVLELNIAELIEEEKQAIEARRAQFQRDS